MMKKLLKFTEIATLPKNEKFPNCQRYPSQIQIAQVENLNEGYVTVPRLYPLYILRNKQSKRVTVGSGRGGSSFYMIQPVPKWS